jgi:hypothetical protein
MAGEGVVGSLVVPIEEGLLPVTTTRKMTKTEASLAGRLNLKSVGRRMHLHHDE